MWLQRRARVLQEAVDTKQILPLKIDEAINAADMHTKYLTHPVWKKHTWFANNLTKERCDAALARMATARANSDAAA